METSSTDRTTTTVREMEYNEQGLMVKETTTVTATYNETRDMGEEK